MRLHRKLAIWGCCLLLTALAAGPRSAHAASPDLSGHWQQDDEGPNIVLIAQDHDAVLVIFDGATPQGRKITYYGSGTISGHKVEYSYIFTRCPDGWKNGDMNLTLSPDGQSMSGQWVAGWDRGVVHFRRLR